MSGFVRAPFTDADLKRLLDWYDAYDRGDLSEPEDDRLAKRLENYLGSVACKGGRGGCNCDKGGSCHVR